MQCVGAWCVILPNVVAKRANPSGGKPPMYMDGRGAAKNGVRRYFHGGVGVIDIGVRADSRSNII